MPKNLLLESVVVQFIQDHPDLYTPLHAIAREHIRGKSMDDQADVMRPLALGRLAAMRNHCVTYPAADEITITISRVR